MLILGIDPSLRSTGYAIIRKNNNSFSLVEADFINNKKVEEDFVCMQNIYNKMLDLLNTYQVNIVGMEATFVNKNAQTSLKLGLVRGMCYAVAISKNIKLLEFSPTNIKKTITGNGNAEKTQIDFMVKQILGSSAINFKNNDISDAIAVAITTGLNFNVM
jgi:crossover junction endodeoxyribonuclease RuvC